VEETLTMLGVYRRLVEDDMRIPVISGEKTPGERSRARSLRMRSRR